MKRQLKSRDGLLLRGRPVALVAPVNDNGDKARWIQVAEEGLYLGHKAGPFEFNELVFDQLVANFRRLPEYQRGADGWGCNRVIPFDWDHASERKTGTIEQQAAQGWAWDVDKRRGPDGKLELWALAEALEPAKTLIREGKIAWTSVAVWPDATDQISGENIGYYMSSIAWTNDPFIRGMVPIAASRNPILADTQYIDPWVRPCSAAECIEALRRLFGLPLQADLGQVLGELAKLKATVAGQHEAAPGVDVTALVKALRQLFNLPTMATPQEVFAETDKLLGSLAADEELVSPSKPQPRLNSNEGISMDEKQLMAILAGRLAVPANAQAVHDAVAKKLDDQSATLLGRARDVAITFAKGGSDPMGLVKGILGALGMQEADITAACDKIGNTFAMAKQLTDLMPEFAKMYEGRAAAEDEAAEGDVQQAMSMSRVPESMQADVAQSMMWSRTGGIDLPRLPRLADGKTIDHTPLLDDVRRKAMFSALEQRETKRTEFAQKVQGNGPALFGRGGNGQPQQQSALFQRWFAPGQQQGGNGFGNQAQSLFGRQGQGLPFGGQQQQQGWGAAAWPGQTPVSMGQGALGRPQQGPAMFDAMRQQQAPVVQIDGVEVQIPDLSDAGGINGANETERAKNYLLSNGYKGDYDALMARANMLAEAYVHSSQPQGGGRF